MKNIPTCAICGKPVDPRMHVAVKSKVTKQTTVMHTECAERAGASAG